MRLITLLAAVGVLHGSLAHGAGPSPRPADPGSAALLHGLETHSASTPDQRAPATPVDREGRPGRPSRAVESASAAAAVAAICGTSEFESLSGGALVSKIKSCDIASLNNLYVNNSPSAIDALRNATHVPLSTVYGVTAANGVNVQTRY